VSEAIQRLALSGVKSKVGDPAKVLQDERTLKLTLSSAPPSYVSAIFRMQLTANAAPDVLRVSGDSSLDTASEQIRKLQLPNLVPTHSTARVLRDAVISCSAGKKDCYLVLMPLAGIQAERTVN
jgi:hypothetical protein